MSEAICGFGLVMLMASAAAAQSVVLGQPQPAYHDYVRSMQNDKNIRTGKSTVFTYAQWVQYCRGEFSGQVVRSRWRRDTTCRNFVNPPDEQFVAGLPALQQITPPARAADLPSNWNSMDAQQQASWLCLNRNNDAACSAAAQRINSKRPMTTPRAVEALPENWNIMDAQQQAWWMCKDDPQRVTARCAKVTKEGMRPDRAQAPNWTYDAVETELARRQRVMEQANTTTTHLSRCSDAVCTSVPNPNYRPAPAAPCGRACGEPWTDADFAAANAEIARLEQEIARLSARRIAPAPVYQTYVYSPPAPQSTTRSRIGGTTYYSGDVSGTATSLPPFTYYNFSNGVSGSSSQIGSFAYHNFRNQRGDTTRGTTSTIGDFQYHNFNNGLRGTTTTIGDFKYTNYNDGTRCTANTIGDYTYTTCQ